MSEAVEFYAELFQEIHSHAASVGGFAEDSFFEIACSHLIDAGEIDTAARAQYSARGIRVDGYGGDPRDEENVLTVITTEFDQSPSANTLNMADVTSAFRRLGRFVIEARSEEFRVGLEESSPVFGLSELISVRWPRIRQVRMILISNKRLSARVDRIDADEVDGIPVSHSVWDLDRFERYVLSGREKEELVIDVVAELGAPLAVLPAHSDGNYQSYLAAFPGSQLAQIYDRWGARLLEQNVRCFLQFRSKVNKGIRNTIKNEPEMFFAFNNGIAATAEEIETVETPHGLAITKMVNFQIVNGGQTTASLHAAMTDRKSPAPLEQVFVPMKLSVIEAEEAREIVPRVSEYANSQNRVSASDFFSNHPFHIRMEDFSRRIYAPAEDGSFVQSKWFYERARGQYQDARGYLTTAERKRFDLEYPKKQMFTKTDLAKFLNVWEGKPETVSKGAQKNFASFANDIAKQWRSNPDSFNEAFYRQAIAKAIIFRFTERLVSAQPWYEGGYRANVVAYTLSKLAHDLKALGKELDFEAVWQAQDVADELDQALVVGAEQIHGVITNPVGGIQNVTEWAKKEACWQRVQAVIVEWPTRLWRVTIGGAEKRARTTDARREQRLLNGIEAQTAVVEAGAPFWSDVLTWGSEHRLLSEIDRGVLEVAARIPRDVPSDRQCIRIVQVMQRLDEEGYPPAREFLTGG